MDNELISLVQLLIKKPYITLKELELALKATRRQVKYRIGKLNEELLLAHAPEIILGQDRQLLLHDKTKTSLTNMAEQFSIQNSYYFNKKERQLYMYITLFMNMDYLTLQHFIDTLEVSRSTVISDLKDLESSLEKDHIHIRNNRTKGYYLYGEEMEIRRYMMQEVISFLADEKNSKALDRIIDDFHLDIFNYSKLVILELAQKHQIRFVEDRLVEFIYIFIFLKARINHSHYAHVYQDVLPKETIRSMKESDFTRELLKHYKHVDDINDEDIDYISSWILGISFGDINEDSEDCMIISELIWKIMIRFETLSGIHYKNSEQIFMQLYAHLRPAYYRLLFKLPILNPLCEKIKDEYPELFRMVMETMKPFAPIFGKEIPDDEIAYLTMHFATIYANSRECESIVQKTALIVCSNGIGSSAILYNELKNLFPEILFLPPVESAHVRVDQAIDIIFATEYVMDVLPKQIPIIKVSPVMTMRERYQVVRDVYVQLGSNFLKRPDVDMVMDIVKKHTNISNEQGLYSELLSYFSQINSRDDKFDEELHLFDMVSPSIVHLDVIAHSWEDAIQISYQSMIKQKMVTQGYVEDIIKAVKRTGPYIVITKHVALPHSKPESGALQCAMGITILKEPVVFGNEDNDPVKYIFALSAIDNEKHLMAMSELLELLNDVSFYHILDHAQHPIEIIEYLKRKG